MKSKSFRFLLSIALFFLLATNTWAVSVKFGLSGGLRHDDFDWNIAGTMAGTNPNILSELTWDDVWSVYLDSELIVASEKQLVKNTFPFLKLSGGYGWIFDGENTDSDYLGDNRTLEFLRSEASNDGDEVWDLAGAFGLSFQIPHKSRVLVMSPYVGYTYRAQNFRMTDGITVINQVSGETGPFAGLDSTYEAAWYGPFCGLRLEYRTVNPAGENKFLFWGEGEYTWFDYEAEADWNLRTDFDHPKSFTHNASGSGFSFKAGADYFILPEFSVGLNGEWTDWTADEDGVHKTYFADETSAKTKLNEVNWESWMISLVLHYYF